MAAKKKKTQLDDFTKGILYCAGILNKYHCEQAAQFILKESSNLSMTKQEMIDGGLDEFDVENLFPTNEKLKVFREIGS